jgi:membrane-bound lytic murein transglycosylase D
VRGSEPPRPADDSTLLVRLQDGRTLSFASAFIIGREAGCEVRIDHTHVSRRHAEVSPLRGQWVIRDLQSSNGLFVDGKRVAFATISQEVDVTLGTDGPVVRIEAAVPAAAEEPHTEPASVERTQLDAYAQRYFAEDSDEPAGEHTMMIRRAFQDIQRQQRRRHRLTIAAIGMVALAIASYAVYQHSVIRRQEQLAEQAFYRMKLRDVEQARRQTQSGDSPEATDAVARYMAQRRAMERDYEGYAAKLYDRTLNAKEQLILRVTRLFGECDVAAPPGYIREVTRFIEEWQRTKRFEEGIKRARDLGYTQPIAEAFMARGLPPQYFYLALVESDFNAFATGSKTRYGYAKGMWQFIPETGARYGLKIGPLASVPGPDPGDDRFMWRKSTDAAARYIKYIYATDAQASGLLVMASYNWGEHRVIDLVRKLPDNPRERNFWQLLAKHRVPDESYNYVFRIVSAAVIGENPRLFGFQFDSPLKFLEQRQGAGVPVEPPVTNVEMRR